MWKELLKRITRDQPLKNMERGKSNTTFINNKFLVETQEFQYFTQAFVFRRQQKNLFSFNIKKKNEANLMKF